MKPAELDAQIRKRAQSKFRVSNSAKFQVAASSNVVDPEDLVLMADTFCCENQPVSQIALKDVAANRAGLAVATVAQTTPFLHGAESLSISGLAFLTTTPIDTSEQGLLPVTNLRFPAIYTPTGEPILLDGSLVQLGDQEAHTSNFGYSGDPGVHLQRPVDCLMGRVLKGPHQKYDP